MNFYQTLNPYYDDLFGFEESIFNFLCKQLPKNGAILDAACGTGTYAIALLEEGIDVYGIDISQDMVRRAGEKAGTKARTQPKSIRPIPSLLNGPFSPRPPERFMTMDMQKIDEHPSRPFSSLYCIGNSLSHLDNGTEVRRFFEKASAALEPEGRIIIQLMNASRLKIGEVWDLPLLEGERARLERRYERIDAEKLLFSARLETEDNGSADIEQSLLVIGSRDIEQWIRDAGFNKLSFYGSYDGSDYDERTSNLLVVIGEVASYPWLGVLNRSNMRRKYMKGVHCLKPRGCLMIEHRLIEKGIEKFKAEKEKLEKQHEFNPIFIDTMVDFIRTYADRTHHGKEEDILFKSLEGKPLSSEEASLMSELVEEHKYARKITGELVKAKNAFLAGDESQKEIILSRLQSLVDLYPEHIRKEDKIFFPDTERHYSTAELDRMRDDFYEFDRQMIHEKYGKTIDSV